MVDSYHFVSHQRTRPARSFWLTAIWNVCGVRHVVEYMTRVQKRKRNKSERLTKREIQAKEGRKSASKSIRREKALRTDIQGKQTAPENQNHDVLFEKLPVLEDSIVSARPKECQEQR